jgi:hypothetical protein
MRRTLLAVGFAVLASLMLVPHVIISGGQRYVWRPFFMQGWASGRAPYYGDHVMWGGLILQTAFACVLAAIIVNIRWRRTQKVEKPPVMRPDKLIAPPPTPLQKETEPNSMKAVAEALDETDHQQAPVNPQATTPKASATTGTGQKSIWRLIVGFVLMGGAVNSSHKLPAGFASQDPVSKISYFATYFLLTAIGVWLMISYRSKRPIRALLIVSVGWLIAVGGLAYTFQKSAESNKQLGNAMRAFANDWQGYVRAGGSGALPTVKPTGDATTDLLGHCMNNFSQEVGSFFDGMYKELDALGEKDVFETSVLTNKANLETEARKRIEGQRIIATYRSNLPRTIDAWRQKLASYNLPGEQKSGLVNGFENGRPKFSHQYETLFNLLGNKEKAQFDFLSFMAGAFNEYKLNDGKIFFNNATVRQRYRELTKEIEDTIKETAAFRKESLENASVNLQKLSQ